MELNYVSTSYYRSANSAASPDSVITVPASYVGAPGVDIQLGNRS
jgi:hypothetical protein